MVYKTMIQNGMATSAIPGPNLEHGEVELTADKRAIVWLALDSPDKDTAIDIANKVVKALWSKDIAHGIRKS